MATTTTTLEAMRLSLLASAIRRAAPCRAPGLLAVLTLPLLMQPVQAADWTFKPRVEVRESYSDNIRLQPVGQEQGDFVTEIIPGFSLTGVGRRLKVKADYALDAAFYARNSNENNLLQIMNGDMAAELLDDLLFFDARASISQQNINAFGPVATDTISASANRAEVRTLTVSPYIRHRFGSFAKGEVRYAHDRIDTSNDQLASARTDRVAVTLESGSRFTSLGWGLGFNTQKTEYESSQSVDITTYVGNLRYALSPTFAVTASAGHESYGYKSLIEDSEGNFGTIGLSWKPSTRTSVDASVGRRFFGNTYMLMANHRARRSVWAISYNEDITTTQAQFQNTTSINTASSLNRLFTTSIPDATVRSDAVDAFVRDTGLPTSLAGANNGFSNRFFLQKSLQASVALNGIRNTVVVNAYNTLRKAQSELTTEAILLDPAAALALDEASNSRQIGMQALWNTRLSPITNANLSAGLSQVKATTTAREDRIKTVRLALTHRFSRKLKGSVELRRLHQNSSVPGSNVRENAVAASLSTEF